MDPTREPRLVLISTSLTVIVLLVFVLSFAGVFVMSRRDSIGDTTRSSETIDAAVPTLVAEARVPSNRTAVTNRPRTALPPPPLLVLLGAGSLVVVGGAVVWRRRRRGRPIAAEHHVAPAPSVARAAVDGPSLRMLRRDQQVIYSTLSQRTGLSVRYLAEIENGLRRPERGDLERIRLALAQEEQPKQIEA